MRRKLYKVIEHTEGVGVLNKLYSFFMIVVIIASLIPLAFKDEEPIFLQIEKISVIIFIIDYFLRFITADIKLEKRWASFFIYPFTPMAIVDLISILPSLMVLNQALKLFRMFRLLRTMKVLRSLKFLRYSKSLDMIVNVLKKQKKVLTAVAALAVAYILVSALVIYNVEPESFDTFFDAVYWATISLTTVGYGDIYPVTMIGRVVTMTSSVLGIAIIALPSGVITAGYLDEINKNKDDDDDEN